MNIGISEIVILIVNVIIFVGTPLIILGAWFYLSRRIKTLETRIEKLEARDAARKGQRSQHEQ